MYEYVVLHDTVSVLHSNEQNGKMIVKIFDNSNGIWREMNILAPDLAVMWNNGFTPNEIAYYINFIKNNFKLMRKYAKIGGINNA